MGISLSLSVSVCLSVCLSLSLSLSPISKHPFLFLLFVSVLYHLNPSYLFILGMPESPIKGRPKRILQEAKPGQPPGLQQVPDVRRCRPDQSLSSEPRPHCPSRCAAWSRDCRTRWYSCSILPTSWPRWRWPESKKATKLNCCSE